MAGTVVRLGPRRSGRGWDRYSPSRSRRGLTRVVFESQIEEVLTGLLTRTVVDTATFVDDHDLVELLPDALTRLIEVMKVVRPTMSVNTRMHLA